MTRRLALLLFVLAVLVAPPALGADCRKCEDRGLVPCPKCAKVVLPTRNRLLFTTAGADCSKCRGAHEIECKRCDAAPAVDLAAGKAAWEEWRAGLAPFDEHMGRALHHAETEHFRLTWDIPKIDAPGGSRPEGGLHLYADRLEDLFADVRADLGAEDADFSAKTHVFLWNRKADQEKASLKWTLQPSSTESKLMGARPVVSIYYDKGHLHEEFELHQAVVHQVVHCLLSNAFDGIWPGNIRGGWIDEGLAHAYENRYWGEVRHYCYVENDTIAYFKFGRWEPEVRIAVDRDEALSFLSVANKNTVEMTPEERMFAWSFVDYLLRAKPGTFGPLAKAIKGKRPLHEGMKEVLGVTPFQFEIDWRAWVQATYSPKKKRR